MNSPGANVLLDNGKRGLLSSGKGAIYNADGECASCCGPSCVPGVVWGPFACGFYVDDDGKVYQGVGDLHYLVSELIALHPGIFDGNTRWRVVLEIHSAPSPPYSVTEIIIACEGDITPGPVFDNLPHWVRLYNETGYAWATFQKGCPPNDFGTAVGSDQEYYPHPNITLVY